MGLTDKIQRLIQDAFRGARITSASPGHINEVIDVAFTDIPDLDVEISKILTEDSTFKRFTKDNKEKVEKIEKHPLLNFTQDQIQNVTAMASNPAGFLISTVFRKFAKGAGVLTLAVILFEAVKVIVDELFKPGRILDTRFRETIDRQLIVFMSRKEQKELDQGIRPFITSTLGGLRGDSLAGQIGGNLYNPYRISPSFLDRRRVSNTNLIAQKPQMRQFLDPKTYRGVMQ